LNSVEATGILHHNIFIGMKFWGSKAGLKWVDQYTNEQFHQNWIGGGGIGLRLILPGSVLFRFDVAAGESGVDLGLFISGREKAVAQRDRVR